jgi:hypothetical protein
MDHRRFLGFGAAFAAAPLATGCSDHDKISVAGVGRSAFEKGLRKTGKGGE